MKLGVCLGKVVGVFDGRDSFYLVATQLPMSMHRLLGCCLVALLLKMMILDYF